MMLAYMGYMLAMDLYLGRISMVKQKWGVSSDLKLERLRQDLLRQRRELGSMRAEVRASLRRVPRLFFDQREDELRSLDQQALAAVTQAARSDEYTRNRTRVVEIWNLVHVIHKNELELSSSAMEN